MDMTLLKLLGEPVRRRLKLVRKGNRAQWKFDGDQKKQNSPLPLIATPLPQTDSQYPKKSMRMESSVSVETRVCVRGKCELVTKH